MGTAGNEAENWSLDSLLGDGHVANAGSVVYVALFKTPGSDSAVGTEPNSGDGYSRVAVANNSTNWPNASNGIKSNGTSIIFPTATAAWGVVVGWGIMRQPSGPGVPIFYSTIDPQFEVVEAMAIYFKVNDLQIRGD